MAYGMKANRIHIRDAIVSAWAAAEALNSRRNLYELDDESQIYRIADKAVYWWPEERV